MKRESSAIKPLHSAVPSPGNRRLPHIDGLRGIAIVAVVLWHYFATRAPTLPGTWQSTLKHLLLMSWSGVDLFFVISGFLITGILYDELGASNYFRTFYIRRAARILPLYLVLMGTYILFLHVPYFQQRQFNALFNPRLPLWSYATFTQNIMMGARQIFGGNWVNVTWSLGPEEQFYAVVPCLIFLGGRKLLPYCLALFLVLAPTLRFVSPGFHTLYNTLWRADGLAAGAVLAWLMRRPGWFEGVKQHRYWLFGLFGFLLIGMGLMNQSSDILGPFGTTVVAAFYTVGLLITLLETQAFTRRILSWKPLVWIGRRSYGIYLIHMPVYGLLFGLIVTSGIAHAHPLGAFRLLMTSATSATLVLAELSFRLLESPIISWGHRYKYFNLRLPRKSPAGL